MSTVPRKGERHPAPVEFMLDTNSYVPYYQQVVDQVRSHIKSGVLKEGDVFRSEGEVAAQLRISKMPVRQAFLKLRSEGLLIVEKGKRPVIGSGQVPWNFQQLRGFSEEMRRRGLSPSARLLSLKRTVVAADIATSLKLDANSEIFELRRLRLVDGQPVALVTSFVPVKLFPDLDQQDLEQSLYQLFEQKYGRKLSWAEEEIGATTATDEVARTLGTSAGAALLLVRETTFDVRNTPIEHSHSLLRADRYRATVVSHRKRVSESPEPPR